jgi:hypothetical protein
MVLKNIYKLVNKMIGGGNYIHYGVNNNGEIVEITSMWELSIMSETKSEKNKYAINMFNTIPYFNEANNQLGIKKKILSYMEDTLKKNDNDLKQWEEYLDKITDVKELMSFLIGHLYISDNIKNDMKILQSKFFLENQKYMDHISNTQPYEFEKEGLGVKIQEPLFTNNLGYENSNTSLETNKLDESIIKELDKITGNKQIKNITEEITILNLISNIISS